MSDEGEKTCPLCAEEMDLTDQQLKPCRCGYEICVWCWHHIMDMAEKDESEGRCPACRTPYDKERIVGTASKCERLVAEISMEKKQKSQKAKVKPSESRKQLSSVRVIQRNLVYIVGLPLNLADEDLLQHKEYFAQYGKVLKVSISRTSAGTIQQFANNTCSVYITYGKEEEAVRCIQSVHGFILDGRPLRACFGTTKYCHAWLRNVPCSNPDCLYLHEIGSHEDSFTKDEIISAYTRSRVQQITGFTNNMQRRSGNALPPPADDYCSNSPPVIGKPVVKSTSNNSASSVRGSPPTSSSGKSGALPPAAAWGARAANCTPPAGSLACSNGPTKQKAEVNSGEPVLSATVSGSIEASILPGDGGKKVLSNGEVQAKQTKNKMEILTKQQTGVNSHTVVSEVSSTPPVVPAVKSASQSCLAKPDVNTGEGSVQLNSKRSVDGEPSSLDVDKGNSSIADENIQNLCSDISVMGIDDGLKVEHSDAIRPNGLCLDNFLSHGRGIQWHDSDKFQEHSTIHAATTAASVVDSVTASSELCARRLDVPAAEMQNVPSETEDDFESQRLRDAIVVNQAAVSSSSPLHLLNHLRGPLQNHVDAVGTANYTLNPPIMNRMPDDGLARNASGVSVASNGFLDNFVGRASGHDNSALLLNVGQGNQIGRFERGRPDCDSQPALDMGESNIIQNILDLDSWDESLTSPQDLAKLLGETDKQEGPLKSANPWKSQISNQSRFSFARQEESRNHLFDFESPFSNFGQVAKNHPFGQGFAESREPYLDRLSNGFGFPHQIAEPSDNLTSGHTIFSSSKHSSSRSQISAPPGFSAPSRPPPPGFTSHERSDQIFDMKSGNHLIESSSMLRNPYQGSPSGNISPANDIEFIDPAILAVGKGRLPSGVNNSGIDMRPNFHVQTPAFENESRLQLMMQRSISPHQNLRYNDIRDNFSPPNDAYGFTSRHMEQSHASNLSPFSQFSLQQPRNTVVSNGHWDSWNEIPAANDVGIAELLRNDRMGFNKFGMANSGDIYNRSFRM